MTRRRTNTNLDGHAHPVAGRRPAVTGLRPNCSYGDEPPAHVRRTISQMPRSRAVLTRWAPLLSCIAPTVLPNLLGRGLELELGDAEDWFIDAPMPAEAGCRERTRLAGTTHRASRDLVNLEREAAQRADLAAVSSVVIDVGSPAESCRGVRLTVNSCRSQSERRCATCR